MTVSTRWIPPWDSHRYARPQPQPTQLLPAPIAAMAADWDPPFGSSGATIVPSSVPAPQQTVASALPPPPNWAEEERERRERGEPDAEPWTPLPPAAETIRRGEHWDPPAPGPWPTTTPLQPIKLEEPDWKEEERRAARENRRAQLEHARKLVAEAALAEEQPGYPPPRREPA